jgi:hypothetical protein
VPEGHKAPCWDKDYFKELDEYREQVKKAVKAKRA